MVPESVVPLGQLLVAACSPSKSSAGGAAGGTRCYDVLVQGLQQAGVPVKPEEFSVSPVGVPRVSAPGAGAQGLT